MWKGLDNADIEWTMTCLHLCGICYNNFVLRTCIQTSFSIRFIYVGTKKQRAYTKLRFVMGYGFYCDVSKLIEFPCGHRINCMGFGVLGLAGFRVWNVVWGRGKVGWVRGGGGGGGGGGGEWANWRLYCS